MSALENTNDQPQGVLSGFMSYSAVRSTHGWLWYILTRQARTQAIRQPPRAAASHDGNI